MWTGPQDRGPKATPSHGPKGLHAAEGGKGPLVPQRSRVKPIFRNACPDRPTPLSDIGDFPPERLGDFLGSQCVECLYDSNLLLAGLS